jgi:predicted lipid-binding transport protein (Tim44 family)
MIFGVDHADARRFGGGFSFGKSFNKRATPAPRFQKKQTMPNKQGRTSPARGGMMGMLGGLALGGLLGALFFGGGFEGINLFDIVIFGAIAWMILSFMRRKAQSATSNYAYTGQQPHNHTDAFTSAGQSAQVSGTMLRPEIDESHFIPAAKDIFMRMQHAWDNKDIEDIRKFCSPEVADKIEADIKALGDASNHTDVTMLQAEIADAWVESDYEWVAIHFNALLKEDSFNAQGETTESQTHEANETWIFRHAPQSDDPTWYLAGIQQGH